MSEYVTDTHSLYWHLANDPRLSRTAGKVFQDADAGQHRVHVPGIALIEMVYLVEKGRLDAALVARALGLLDTPGGSYIVSPLDLGTARALATIPRSDVPDMPDRIIVATARQLGLPLITRDGAIRRSRVVPVIW